MLQQTCNKEEFWQRGRDGPKRGFAAHRKTTAVFLTALTVLMSEWKQQQYAETAFCTTYT